MLAVFKKEMRAYFTTPIGYVFLAVFIAVGAVIFARFTYMAGEGEARINDYFSWMVVAYVLLIPILTMKIFSDELKGKTDQLLLTSPVSITGIVVAKYFAALCMYLLAVAVSSVNYIFLAVNGYKLQFGIAAEMFIFMILIGLACIAVGIFISALTESQLVAALISMVTLSLMLFTGAFNNMIPFAWLRTLLDYVSISSRYKQLADGLFDFTSVLYYISLAGVFVLLTIRVFEKKRWH